jgi:hypothetical protein
VTKSTDYGAFSIGDWYFVDGGLAIVGGRVFGGLSI